MPQTFYNQPIQERVTVDINPSQKRHENALVCAKIAIKLVTYKLPELIRRRGNQNSCLAGFKNNPVVCNELVEQLGITVTNEFVVYTLLIT